MIRLPRALACASAVIVVVAVSALIAPAAAAQGATTPTANTYLPSASPPVNAVVQRARIMTDAGEGENATKLLDSLVAALPRATNDAAEALYWRALMSEDAASAELDWKRIVVESPISPRAPVALLRLSELSLMRNDYAVARRNIQQLLADHPEAPERPRALLVLARSYFDERDAPRACGVLTAVRREAPISAVEVRLQADEMQQQCRNVREVALGAEPDATLPADPSATATGSVPTLTTQTAALPPSSATAATNRGDTASGNAATRTSASGAGTSGTDASVTGASATGASAVSSARAAAVADSLAKANERSIAKARADSIARAAAVRKDSVARAQTARNDSVIRANAARKDSIANAQNARNDSIARLVMARNDSIARAAAKSADSLRAVVTRDSVLRDSLTRVYDARDRAAGRATATERARRDSATRIANTVDSLAKSVRGGSASGASANSGRSGTTTSAAKSGRWAVQVAAYKTREQANALAKKLNASNMNARVVGTRNPFRVFVGRYATRAEATEALAALKKKGQNGFVAEVPPA